MHAVPTSSSARVANDPSETANTSQHAQQELDHGFLDRAIPACVFRQSQPWPTLDEKVKVFVGSGKRVPEQVSAIERSVAAG